MDDSLPQPIQPMSDPVMPEKTSRVKTLIPLLVILVLLLGVVLLFFRPDKSSVTATLQQSDKQARPTSMPYEEMTIPYLRERKYESTLGEREAVSDNGTYTSYLTSYTSDGLRVNGLLTIPTGEMPNGGWPAIVFIHGYIPPTQYVTTEKYVEYVDALARNGFVVFKIDLRGHGESEGEAGGGYFGSDYVVDALNAYAALSSADFVNADEIGMWGHSMAGNIIMRSLAVKPTIPAAVIWAGAVYSYTDMQKYGIQDSSYRPPETATRSQNRRRELLANVGTPSAESPFWQKVAPINYVNEIKGAIEIHHAEDDNVVNIGYSRDLSAALDKTAVPHSFYEYATGGHNIEGGSFSLAIQRTINFYNQYLKKE